MADSESTIKFFCEETGAHTVARVFSGPDYESMRYSGTIVLATPVFNKMLDSLLYGAGNLSFPNGFQVYYGPDDDRDVA